MNERFEQLARQAANGMLSYDAEGDWSLNQHEVEKFAQLIVRECIGIVEALPSGYQDYRAQIEDAFRQDCVAKIKEHFGVEE